MTLRQTIERRLHYELFGEPIIGNTHRGLYVEAMIAEILAPDWNWVAGDWASWDFEHRERWDAVELKQSAALQRWSDQYDKSSSPRFDIAERTGYWYQEDGGSVTKWHKEKCRPADLYIFAWHGETERATADQRDPEQWEFYLCRSEDLPKDRKSIVLPGLKKITALAHAIDLKEKLEKLASTRPARRDYP